MNDDTRAITPDAIIVYPSLFEPDTFHSDEGFYKALLLFEKDADLSKLRSAMNAAALKKFPGKPKEFYHKLRQPIRNGAEKAVDADGNVDAASFYYNRLFMNVKSKYQPQVINQYGEPITDPDEVYGGCIVRARLSFFGYDYLGNSGISCSLLSLVKMADGDPIGGGKEDPNEVFADIIRPKPTIFNSEVGVFNDDIPY